MRVVSGKLRGMKLNTKKGNKTRPTRNIVKEALFSILMNEIEDSVFLDFFSGSVAVGIEVISRGAKESIMVDLYPVCV